MKRLVFLLVLVGFYTTSVVAGEWKEYAWENEFGPKEPTRGIRVDSVDGSAALVILRMPRYFFGTTLDVHLAPSKKAAKRIERLHGFQLQDRITEPVGWRFRDDRLRKRNAWRQDGGLRFEISGNDLVGWRAGSLLEIVYKSKTFEFDLSGFGGAVDRLFAATTPENPRRYDGMGGVSESKLIHKVAQEYPPGEVRSGGQIRIQVVIGTDGSLVDLLVWRTNLPAPFQRCAVDAVKQWRYTPAMLNGEPVEVYREVFVDY